MSVKDVNNYFDKICDQYQEMIENIKDLEKEAMEGLIPPERVDMLKEQIAPIKQNYERWSYMMFLLHQPVRKSKVPRYKQQNAKLLKSLDTANNLDSVLRENEQVLKETHV